MPPDTNSTPPEPHSNSPRQAGENGSTPAVNLIRQKVERLYATEPDAEQELTEVEAGARRSKHQQFMHELSTSGKDFATIQTEWHNYYQQLPTEEKHEVWQEFYASQTASPFMTTAPAPEPTAPPEAKPEPASIEPAPAVETLPQGVVVSHHQLAEHKQAAANAQKRKKQATARAKRQKAQRDRRSAADIKATLKDKVSAGGKLEAKHHVQSLLFGLGMGCLVLLIFLFSFFNEVIIAPFIQPSRATAATPLIISSDSVAPTAQPEVIIPKINVEIPVDYSQTTTDESQIENALNSGVVHYPTTALPGQVGNTAYFGHSSNNIFNKGKYKFAFVLLHTLVPGDTFYLTYNGKVYVYKVFLREIVSPNDVGVLGPVSGHNDTATLITCDPPGTSINRLIVVGDQISPDPAGNTTPAQPPASVSSSTTNLPGNGPSLWTNVMHTLAGKAVLVVLIVAALLWLWRWVTAPKRRLKTAT